MITFHPAATYKRRDGTYQVRIRVTFRRQSRYLSTTLTAYPSQLTRSGHIKDAALLSSCDKLIRQLREAAADLNPFTLEDRDVGWVCDYLRAKLRGEAFHLDFFEYADRYLATKRPTTADIYRTALNAFARYLGARSIDVNDITRGMLLDFQDKGTGGGATRGAGANTRYLSLLGTIFTAARTQYNDGDVLLIPRQPFDGLDLRLPHPQGQKALDVELMQIIIDARPRRRLQAVALAAFVVSFGTMGANFADLWAAAPFKGRTWKYERQKTRERRADRAKMEVEIDPRLRHHLALLEGEGPWWLPEIHKGESCKNAARVINRALAAWQKAEGLPSFTFYAARHSWATLARSAGVEKATVDEGLAHVGDFRVADIYAQRDWRRINEANRRVLDSFSWPAV